ncbi:hypothetical protein D3C84_896160 [compost metagenome]
MVPSKIVFPHRFSGDVMLAMGATLTTPMNHVKAIHRAVAWIVAGSAITYLRMVTAISFNSAAPSTGSGHGSTSGKSSELPVSSGVLALAYFSRSTMLTLPVSLMACR